MNGDDPQRFARMRREPPPPRAGEPPARQQPPRANPAQSPRPRPGGVDPTRKLNRDDPGPALAWSQAPPVRNPGGQPPRPPRDQGRPPRDQAGRPRNPVPPQGNRNREETPLYGGRTREGGPLTHAPTQRPVPYREASPPPPPPPSLPGKRGRGDDGRPPRGARPKKKRHWFRWILSLLLILVLLPIGAAIYVETHLERIDALANYSGRVGDTPGTNWLLVGSDSRAGLTAEQEKELTTGDDQGSERTDTIILVHIPKSGQPTLVSLPRDSYVSIPGHGKDKLNASFAFGGAQLLVQTVEIATGLRIDHYAQIGFGGFANIVDAVGGIDMCLDQAMDDPLAGIDLPAGCQELNGKDALGFVRSRAFARADLDRMQNQRKFLSALLQKVSSPWTLINPFRVVPLLTNSTKSLKVDNGAHIWNLVSLGRALSGDPVATTVPVGGFEDVDGSGNVLLWDKTRAGRFFDALANDQQIPSDLITTVGN
ncbi:LCP family protein [Nocardia sp. NPDC051030]|uniref:LCP family protein n=1 Tax=Nocardia sp. NPDC051030 TaxID=3155162 RepID=UPI0034441432